LIFANIAPRRLLKSWPHPGQLANRLETLRLEELVLEEIVLRKHQDRLGSDLNFVANLEGLFLMGTR